MSLGLRAIAVSVAVIAVGVFTAALIGPWLLDALEASRSPFSFEFALRWELLLAAAVWGGLVLLLWRTPWWFWIVFVGVLTILGWIFAFDVNSELQKELSWIRYPTAGALFIASLFALLYSIRARGWFWILFTFGFLYAGLDELLELHERIGSKLEQWFRLPHVTTDLITVAYAIAGAVVSVIALRFLWSTKRLASGVILLVAVTVFAVSQALDTFDVLFDPAMRKLALLFSKKGYIFSDSWYFFYEPKRFANSLEEVLEFLAAVCFGLAMLFLLHHIDRIPLRHRWNALASRAWIALTLLISLLLVGAVAVPARSPLLLTSQWQQLGGPSNGLVHSDDLFFDSQFGVLLANEGGHTVMQWKDGKLARVADSERVLRDMDSVTAANDKIYVADGDAGKIFSSSGDGNWQIVADRSNGLKHPEGIVVVDNAIIGVDESEKGLFTLSLRGVPSDGTTKQSQEKGGIATARTGGPRTDKKNVAQAVVDWFRPNAPGFTAPEGIAYDSKNKRLLVTDDKTGALWSVAFAVSAERVAISGVSLKNPEDIEVLPNGDILLSDNGRGEVLLLSSSSGNSVTLNRLLRFRRMYRDLQGVTADAEGNLYVVTADSYASASFMPSFLWRVSTR